MAERTVENAAPQGGRKTGFASGLGDSLLWLAAATATILFFFRNCSPGGLSGYSVSWLRQLTAFPCRAMVMATRGLYPSAAMVWR